MNLSDTNRYAIWRVPSFFNAGEDYSGSGRAGISYACLLVVVGFAVLAIIFLLARRLPAFFPQQLP